MDKFVIPRDKWLRGESAEKSMLLRQDGKMCCIGVYGKHCGYSDVELIEEPTPSFVIANTRKNLFHKAFSSPGRGIIDTKFVIKLMAVNDSPNISDKYREKFIRRAFRLIGVEVEFE